MGLEKKVTLSNTGFMLLEKHGSLLVSRRLKVLNKQIKKGF